ncbi:DNA polymerase IV [Verrucomicrobium sp. BvORR034]|jgi:DNA polymerase-4|uniref:DNA polymerase IV n=1 Tax=Verrucomicrobium sp. BvORR034 TaxID=1396418 RepID=UPI0006793664|nr:DNA polymerase IV [Verrucomicrobium sp. BvORR034]
MAQPRIVMHVDMDAFFASIEQRDHPEFQGKPVIVGSPPDQRGVVCAASYEARAFKVHSAMPSRTAGKLCPQGIFVRPRMHVYRAESAKIMQVLQLFSACIEQVSVDEAYLDVSPSFQDYDDQDTALEAAEAMAREIKARIKQEVQLTATVGLGSNKFLAKLGSGFQKPDGLTLIRERDKIAFLRPLPVGAIHGVGPVTAKELNERGFMTVGDLQETTIPLNDILGSWSATLKQRALGTDDRPVDPTDERKSISSENTFLNDTDDRPTLRTALKELALDVAQTLEKEGVGALTIQVKVRYSDFTTLTRQLRVDDPLTQTDEIYRLACHLLARHQLVKSPLRLIGIGVSTLVPPVRTQLRLPL